MTNPHKRIEELEAACAQMREALEAAPAWPGPYSTSWMQWLNQMQAALAADAGRDWISPKNAYTIRCRLEDALMQCEERKIDPGAGLCSNIREALSLVPGIPGLADVRAAGIDPAELQLAGEPPRPGMKALDLDLELAFTVDPPKPVCSTCNDTHQMFFTRTGHYVGCTRCPSPCQKCRQGGNGPYCENTPCPCHCHVKKEAV